MSRILGLDLGSNSIGWAIIENNSISSHGVYITKKEENKYSKNIMRKTQKTLNDKLVISGTISVLLFVLASINLSNWQFWLNLGISALLVNISLRKK